ncbi:class I SAM-dependent methyltransferase [Shivajiella indica]|uniref:Class I SAM-dependent methyltransferase n=1 Tax=Shivajiella indica TaxID=872115 RepID=A0ABW5BCQ4_9BACT
MIDNIGKPFFSSFKVDESLNWQMSRAEKYTLIGLLQELKPDVAIEIGTYQGGSLQVISHYSKNVYSIDISKAPGDLLASRFSNVEFVVGDSSRCLIDIFEKIKNDNRRLDFILVDGDHTRKGVYRDLEAIYSYPHIHPVTILMHDSFNPECRKGIRDFLKKHPEHITYAELDYVTGSYWHNDTYREMWGGLAMVKMDPNHKSAPIEIGQSQKHLFAGTYLHSIHLIKDRLQFLFPLKRKIFKMLGKKNRAEIYDTF